MNQLTELARRIKIFLGKGPFYLWAYGGWRATGRWLRVRDSFAWPNDRPFFAALDLTRPELEAVHNAVARGDFSAAGQALVAHFQSRDMPRFHFTEADRSRLLAATDPTWQQETVDAADKVCWGNFHFRGLPVVTLADPVDWTFCPNGNRDWTWDLNRHPYFVTLGRAWWYTDDEQYAARFVSLMLDWIERNPAGVGRPNWDSVLEVAARLNHWIWAYLLFRQSPGFSPLAQLQFLKALWLHARYLHRRLERHVANNHLLLEAKALTVCGLLFPEFRASRRWLKEGLSVLWHEVAKQVCADGVHGERAPLYHLSVSSELLELLLMLERNDHPVPVWVPERFQRMLDFERDLIKPDGTIPLFGDSALSDNYARFSGLRGWGMVCGGRVRLGGLPPNEETTWLLGGRRRARPVEEALTSVREFGSRAYPEGGYLIMRGGTGAEARYLAFDCGPFGYPAVPHHGHADALSFELFAYGRTLITDAGVYGYSVPAKWRNYFRGSRAHNTVMVDGQDQSQLVGTMRVYQPATATLRQWISHPNFDLIDACHDGYTRLPDPVVHRRQVFFIKPFYWVLIDLLEGEGQHQLDLLFHLMPGMEVTLGSASGIAWATYPGGGPGIATVPVLADGLTAEIVTGATSPIQGWVSRESGVKEPASVVCYRTSRCLPVRFCTVLYPGQDGMPPQLRVAELNITVQSSEAASHDQVIGLTVETADHMDHWAMAYGSATGQIKSFSGYESDGAWTWLRERRRDGQLEQVILKDGRHLCYAGQALLTGALRLEDVTVV